MKTTQIEKTVRRSLDNYKKYWEKDVPSWNYSIREYNMPCYKVEIWAGTSNMVCIVRETFWYEPTDNPATQFKIASNVVWNRVLIALATAGAYKVYQDIVQSHREGRINDNGVKYGENPLTISECQPTLHH